MPADTEDRFTDSVDRLFAAAHEVTMIQLGESDFGSHSTDDTHATGVARHAVEGVLIGGVVESGEARRIALRAEQRWETNQKGES